MRGWLLVVLPLLAVQVRAQISPAQKKQACKEACNFAGCYHVTGDAVNTRAIREVINALMTDCYLPQEDALVDPSIIDPCLCNFGAVLYKEDIQPHDICPMWPTIPRVPKEACVLTARDLHEANTTRFDDNHLEKCLNILNNDVNFLHESVLNVEECAYTVAIAGDMTLKNSDAVKEEMRILKTKKVLIHCSFIGNWVGVPLDPAYDYCDVKAFSDDFLRLSRFQTETMFANLNCCRDPDPIPPTTTTTTPAPTTTPRPCDGCAIINGVGYNPHPTRCDCWIRCIFGDDQEGVVNTITNCCGCGMFWDHGLLTCVPATDIICGKDPCLQTGVSRWPFRDRNGDVACRGYWTCSDRRTVSSSCCLAGEEFNGVTETCEPDTANVCPRKCPCEEDTTVEPPCEFVYNELDPQTYYAIQYDNERVLMNCPPGLHFNRTDCKCTTFVPLDQEECEPVFDLQCTEDPVIDHADDVYIRNEGVAIDVDGAQCIFTGNDRLTIPRYANHDFRDIFAMKISFNGEGRENNDKALFSNSDCREGSTVEVKLTTLNEPTRMRKIEGCIVTVRGTKYCVTTDYRENVRNDVYFYYDGKSLNMCVQYADDNAVSVVVNTLAEGLVRICKCAAQIGYGWDNRYFYGRIYLTTIYHCIPDGFCPSVPTG